MFVQLIQLLVCDWLLETRTTCWEMEQAAYQTDEDNNNCTWYTPSPSYVLKGFQNDLNSLISVMDQIPVSSLKANEMDTKVLSNFLQLQMAKSRVYLYEAICRLMAGAAPGQTQELLSRSAHEHGRRVRSTFTCSGASSAAPPAGAEQSSSAFQRRRCMQPHSQNVEGERERAAALYVACKYLPSQLLSLPGERAGMLTEAAKSLKKIGDRKKLKACYQLMKSFGTATSAAPIN